MALRDQLFPAGEANRHDGLLQTEWSKGWADEFMGVGALTHWMTPRLRELHAEMDYAGVAVVFLQRVDLMEGVLVGGGDSCVAEEHVSKIRDRSVGSS